MEATKWLWRVDMNMSTQLNKGLGWSEHRRLVQEIEGSAREPPCCFLTWLFSGIFVLRRLEKRDTTMK